MGQIFAEKNSSNFQQSVKEMRCSLCNSHKNCPLIEQALLGQLVLASVFFLHQETEQHQQRLAALSADILKSWLQLASYIQLIWMHFVSLQSSKLFGLLLVSLKNSLKTRRSCFNVATVTANVLARSSYYTWCIRIQNRTPYKYWYLGSWQYQYIHTYMRQLRQSVSQPTAQGAPCRRQKKNL